MQLCLHMSIGVLLTLAVTPGLAQERVADGTSIYAEAGWTPGAGGRTHAGTIGLSRPLRVNGIDGAFSSHGEVFVSTWRARLDEGHRLHTQVGAIATLRYRFANGVSPWFADAGLGISVLDRQYRAQGREFSSRFQFTEILGVGRSFGMRGEHELSVRVQHFSNAGVRKPNPGENFVRLRYLYRFR